MSSQQRSEVPSEHSFADFCVYIRLFYFILFYFVIRLQRYTRIHIVGCALFISVLRQLKTDV